MHPTTENDRVSGFDCILIPLDGSERAEAALEWVQVLRAQRVRLLQVCPHEHQDGGAARDYLANVAARSYPPDAEIDVRVVAGDPAEQIVNEAAEADVIVMTTQGAGDGGRRLFGSVADRVSRHAPAPTLLLRGGRDPITAAPLQRIVVPLDGSSAAERALPLGVKLAGMLGAPVYLVSVHDEASGDLPHDAGAYLEQTAEAIRARDMSVATEVRAGAPEAELLATVGPGDLLVVTTHGRGAARRWQIGRVAEKLLRHAAAPIVMVRADGD